MKYRLTDRKANAVSTATYPVLKKEDEPFHLPPDAARAYLEEKLIEPVGTASAEEAKGAEIEELKELTKDFDQTKTRDELLKMRKSSLVALAEYRNVTVTPDSETKEQIADKILAAQKGDE